jgi:hypothetical protein
LIDESKVTNVSQSKGYETHSVIIKLAARNEAVIPAISIKPKRTSKEIDNLQLCQIREYSQVSSVLLVSKVTNISGENGMAYILPHLKNIKKIEILCKNCNNICELNV